MHPLVNRIAQGDRRAVARALTLIENDAEGKQELLEGLYPFAGRAQVIGFTGSPGAGKSTLVDRIISHLRRQGLRVGVLAVDPSSPFTGGALLGDRVRMTSHSADPGVYIRSVGSRGSLGGLGRSSGEMRYALEAYGCDVILLETVGVGQAELDVMLVADTVVLVLTPGAGDHVQTAKAGIMEIADVFVINKRELPGTDALVREVRQMLHERQILRNGWENPVVSASAAAGEGIDEVWQAIAKHGEFLHSYGLWHDKQQQRHQRETVRLLEEEFRRYLHQRIEQDPEWQTNISGVADYNPYRAAERMKRQLPCFQPPETENQV